MAKVNHFKGKDPIKWVAGIVTFKSVHMGEIYPGVSLRLQAHANNVEKIFSIHPGADPKKIQLSLDGAKSLRLTAEGELEVNAGAGTMRFTKPVAYQQINGSKAPVDVAYTVEGGSYGFQLAAYDTTKELIIDLLIRAVFKCAPDTASMPTCMAADMDGNIYVAGKSADRFTVFKFDGRLETLLTSATFGAEYYSDNYNKVHDIAVDSQGAIYIAGCTEDEKFPVTDGAFDTVLDISGSGLFAPDGFVIKYNAELNTILAATFIGGDGIEQVADMVIGTDGRVYVCGGTDSTNFPVTEACHDSTFNGFYTRHYGSDFHRGDGFFTIIDPTFATLK